MKQHLLPKLACHTAKCLMLSTGCGRLGHLREVSERHRSPEGKYQRGTGHLRGDFRGTGHLGEISEAQVT